MSPWKSLLVFAVFIVSLPSCRYGPTPIEVPYMDPSGAGSQAMDAYDTNDDGIVAGDELTKAPGLNAALPRLDTNGDKAVSADEVAARVGNWQRGGIGLMSFAFKVTLDGNPVGSAIVTFEPEAFLGDEIKPASCTTNLDGTGGATIAKEDRPDPKSPPGMHLGIYKVKISKKVGDKETIPAKYNEHTILGQEVAQNVTEIANNRVVYALTSK